MYSFVVPVLNEKQAIGSLLSSLRDAFAECELIVVDGGSTDGSVPAALPLADTVLLCEPGRARQMNLGAACAGGDWLCFLHADTRPAFDAAALDAVLDINDRWAFCRVALQGKPHALAMISWCMNRRSALTGVATGDQLLMVRRTFFEQIGGFSAMPLMEDVDICKRMRRLASPHALPLRVISSGRRWEEQGVLLTVLRMWMLRLAFWLGIPAERLWHYYYGKRALAADTPVGGK